MPKLVHGSARVGAQIGGRWVAGGCSGSASSLVAPVRRWRQSRTIGHPHGGACQAGWAPGKACAAGWAPGEACAAGWAPGKACAAGCFLQHPGPLLGTNAAAWRQACRAGFSAASSARGHPNRRLARFLHWRTCAECCRLLACGAGRYRCHFTDIDLICPWSPSACTGPRHGTTRPRHQNPTYAQHLAERDFQAAFGPTS